MLSPPKPAAKQIIVLGAECNAGQNKLVKALVGLHQGPDEPVQIPCARVGKDARIWSMQWMSNDELLAVNLNDVSEMWVWDWTRYFVFSDAVVLCFPLHTTYGDYSLNPISFQYFPEVWNKKRFTPIFLVGINDHPEKPASISRKRCIKEAKRIGAVYYLEFNTTTLGGVNVLFNVLLQALTRKIEIHGDRWEPLVGISGYPAGFDLCGHVCTVYSDRLYLFGGRNRGGLRFEGYYLDLSASQDSNWELILGKDAQFPEFPAYCTSQNGQLVYFFGGTDVLPTEDSPRIFDAAKSRMEAIQVANPSESPPRSYGGTLVIHDNKLYLFGGSVSGWATDGFYEFNLATKIWKELPPQGRFPQVRYHHSSYCKNGVMVILCGLGNNRDKYNDVWSVDLSKASAEGKATWNLIPCRGTPPTPQRGHAGCLLNNDSFMFVGSSNANPQCEFFHFDTNTFTWKEMEMQMSPFSREFFGITAWRNHIIITSGIIRRERPALLSDGYISVTPSLFPETPAQEQVPNTITSDGTFSAFQVAPPDCWMQVIAFLDVDDICRLGRVSTELYRICSSDEVWKKFLPVGLHRGTGLKPFCVPVWKNPLPLVPTIVPQYSCPRIPRFPDFE
ncbi:hypothetical protein Pelo_4158 [Pelomyxa schiedti]|nr:hypothetical protein Pelo_4158 [Pelomyxa schiedti]